MSSEETILYHLSKVWLSYLGCFTLYGTDSRRTKSAYNDWSFSFRDAMKSLNCFEADELMQRIDAFIGSETFKKLWNEEHQ